MKWEHGRPTIIIDHHLLEGCVIYSYQSGQEMQRSAVAQPIDI